MYKLFFLILFCLITFEANGQHAIKKKKEPVIKTFLSASASLYSSDIFPGKYSIRVNDELWQKASGWSSNIQYGIRITKKFDFLGGLGYHFFHIAQIKNFGYWVCDPNNSYINDIDHVERFVRIQTLQIPLELRYKVSLAKLLFYPAMGFAASYYLHKDQYVNFILNTEELIKNSENDLVLDHNRNVNLSAYGKLGVNYPCGSRIKLKTEFFYSYNIGKDDLFNYLIKEYETVNISSLGISIGLEYSLKMIKK